MGGAARLMGPVYAVWSYCTTYSSINALSARAHLNYQSCRVSLKVNLEAVRLTTEEALEHNKKWREEVLEQNVGIQY